MPRVDAGFDSAVTHGLQLSRQSIDDFDLGRRSRNANQGFSRLQILGPRTGVVVCVGLWRVRQWALGFPARGNGRVTVPPHPQWLVSPPQVCWTRAGERDR